MRHGHHERGETTLSSYGMKQVVRVAEKIKEEFYDQKVAVLTSDVQRAKETAELVKNIIGLENEIIEAKSLKLSNRIFINSYLPEDIAKISKNIDYAICVTHQPNIGKVSLTTGISQMDDVGTAWDSVYEFKGNWSDFNLRNSVAFIKKYTPDN